MRIHITTYKSNDVNTTSSIRHASFFIVDKNILVEMFVDYDLIIKKSQFGIIYRVDEY